MNIVTLSTNKDGTLLGADESGKLYTGVIDQVGFDQFTREVINDDEKAVTYNDLAGDILVSSGTVEKANYTDIPHEKVYVDAYDAQGNLTGTVEKTYTVVNWKAQ